MNIHPLTKPTAIQRLCVIGGGLAGLSAGARAAELGVDTLVLEQGAEQHYPCNSRYAGGFIHLSYLDISLPADTLVQELRAKCGDDVDFALIETIARHAYPTVEWLRKVAGAKFVRSGPQAWAKWCLGPPRPLRTSLVWPGRGPDVLLRNLEAYLAFKGGRIRRGATVESVDRNAAGGFDLVVRTASGVETIRSDFVVLADGGFQADPSALAENVAVGGAALVQRNARTARGFGLSTARRLGAKVSTLHRFYGHILSNDAFENDKLWPYPVLDDLATAAIAVDQTGRRFCDEGKGGVYISNELARLSGESRGFIVVDDEIWKTAGRATRIPCNPLLVEAGATIFEAGTLREAARMAGIDPDGLDETVRAHNRNAPDIVPPRSTGKSKPLPLLRAPFRIFPVNAGITYTMGGITIDTTAAVMSESGAAIPGLFAAGATTGNAEGGRDAFYLGGLCKAAVLGRIAGASVAARARQAREESVG